MRTFRQLSGIFRAVHEAPTRMSRSVVTIGSVLDLLRSLAAAETVFSDFSGALQCV
jgi:hypothetical protein